MKKINVEIRILISMSLLFFFISSFTNAQDVSKIDPIDYSTGGFDPSINQLQPKYVGHNLEVVYLMLARLKSITEKKDEFETTSDFKKRSESEFKKPILNSLTLDSIFAFKVKYCNTSYDADKQQLTITCEFFRVYKSFRDNEKVPEDLHSIIWKYELINRGSYGGSNAFGATVEVTRHETNRYELVVCNYDDFPTTKSSENGYERVFLTVDLNVRQEQARIMKSSIATLFISKLTTPFSLKDVDYSPATITSPLSTTTNSFYVFANLIEVWFYDINTGQILLKIKK